MLYFDFQKIKFILADIKFIGHEVFEKIIDHIIGYCHPGNFNCFPAAG